MALRKKPFWQAMLDNITWACSRGNGSDALISLAHAVHVLESVDFPVGEREQLAQGLEEFHAQFKQLVRERYQLHPERISPHFGVIYTTLEDAIASLRSPELSEGLARYREQVFEQMSLSYYRPASDRFADLCWPM